MVNPFKSSPLRQAGWLACLLIAFVLFTSRGTAAEVSASLDKTSVPAGEGAVLKIEISNGRASGIDAPEVADLDIQFRGRFSNSFFDGRRTTSTLILNYVVGSYKPGDYTIPPFTVTVDGTPMKTEALKLKVLPSSAQPPAGLPQGGTGSKPSSGETQDPANTGFVTVETATKNRDYTWVGEIAPVRIKAWLPEGSQIARVSKLQPAGSAFTLHNLSEKPKQTTEVRNGKRYTVLTYYAGLSATKAGTYVPDLTLNATAIIRDQSAVDPFDDPMAGFFARPVQKNVELKTRSGDDSAIEVRALPLNDRPEDFNGAVGKFAFETVSLPDQWQTGEPQTVTTVIKGEGNFNLLAQPELQPAKEWKAYAGQAEFTPQDAASFTGSQSFRFTAMPRKGGAQKVQLGFSYFDPETGHYESVTSPLQTIEVRGENLPGETVAAAADAPKKTPESGGLAPVHASDSMVYSLMPYAFRPSFPAVLGSAGALALVGLLAGWVRRVRGDPERVAREKAERAEREAMHEADSFANRGDVGGFFTAARQALQVKLAALWDRPAQAITLADVTARVPADSPVVAFFREADRLTYSPAHEAGDENLTTWRERLREALHSLTTPVTG